MEMPHRDDGDAGGFTGGGAGVEGFSCSGEEGSAQHLNRAGRLIRQEEEEEVVEVEVVATAKRIDEGRKEMERVAEIVAMAGGRGLFLIYY